MYSDSVIAIAYTISAIVSLGAIFYFFAKWSSGKADKKSDFSDKAMHELEITVGALKTQNSIQARQIEASNTDSKILSKTVSELTGKVDTLSTIPLDKIEKHMADTNRILELVLPFIPSQQTKSTFTTERTTNTAKG